MTDFGVISLTHRSILKLEGSEASSFLQALITQDINLLDTQPSLYTGLLSPQGKILFSFFLHKHENSYLIDCPSSLSEALLMRLNMYKLRADITLSDASSDYGVVVSGAAGFAAPDPRCSDLGGRTIISKSETEQGSSPESDYHIHRIKLGIADCDEIGSSQYFPHECNFDQLNGVSFTKGCFIGQEVVSRMEHRGTARNRIMPFSSDETVIKNNDQVTCADLKLGTVISFMEGHGLALIRIDRLEKTANQNTPILAGSSSITLSEPAWANYSISKNKD